MQQWNKPDLRSIQETQTATQETGLETGTTHTSTDQSLSSTGTPGPWADGSRWSCSVQLKPISVLGALTISSPFTKQPKWFWSCFWQHYTWATTVPTAQWQYGWQWHLWVMQLGKNSFLNYNHWSPAVMFSIENLINKRGKYKVWLNRVNKGKHQEFH